MKFYRRAKYAYDWVTEFVDLQLFSCTTLVSTPLMHGNAIKASLIPESSEPNGYSEVCLWWISSNSLSSLCLHAICITMQFG